MLKKNEISILNLIKDENFYFQTNKMSDYFKTYFDMLMSDPKNQNAINNLIKEKFVKESEGKFLLTLKGRNFINKDHRNLSDQSVVELFLSCVSELEYRGITCDAVKKINKTNIVGFINNVNDCAAELIKEGVFNEA